MDYINWKYLRLYMKIIYSFQFRSQQLNKNKINRNLWKKKFVNLLNSGDVRCEELLTEFLTCQMEKVTNHRVKRRNQFSPILFCVIRNDIKKCELFLEHYRKLGIEVFIFLDNHSDDGTKEFLCEQKDAIVYNSDQQYSSARRVAWLNRLLAVYGQNRWCLIVDSDELVSYIGYEKFQISDMVKKAVENDYTRIEGFLLDMYSKNKLFQNICSDDYVYECKYFDLSSYELGISEGRPIIKGGPRKRVFRVDAILSKCPLFFFKDEDFVASAHYMIPNESVSKCPVWIALCHYKFIDQYDLSKVKEAVRLKNYAGGSVLYKKYLAGVEKHQELSFYEDNNTCEMKNSYSLKNIPFLKTPFPIVES